MKCVICRLGETHAGKIVATLQRGETTVILKNVPAEVCDNCGEYYLSEGIADSLLKRAEVAAQQGSEVESCRHRESSIAGTGAVRKRIK